MRNKIKELILSNMQNIDNEIDESYYTNVDEVVCPHCGNEYHNYDGKEFDVRCDSCGKLFNINRIETIKYSTTKCK